MENRFYILGALFCTALTFSAEPLSSIPSQQKSIQEGSKTASFTAKQRAETKGKVLALGVVTGVAGVALNCIRQKATQQPAEPKFEGLLDCGTKTAFAIAIALPAAFLVGVLDDVFARSHKGNKEQVTSDSNLEATVDVGVKTDTATFTLENK